MEGTRLRILQLLQKNNSDTVDRLARTIGLAPATIRRHLDILQRDRLVAFQEVRKPTGRPEYSFYLTEEGQEALPKDYDELLGMMLREIAELSVGDLRAKDGQQILELVFRRLSDRVASTYRDSLVNKDLPHRLAVLMAHLADEDFFPEAEVADGTLRIRLVNCPFRSVALQNKAVCTFDLNLISSLLDLNAERDECISDGDKGCVYTAPIEPAVQKRLASSSLVTLGS